jgi:hypothetical protein
MALRSLLPPSFSQDIADNCNAFELVADFMQLISQVCEISLDLDQNLSLFVGCQGIP